jgi:hypothetical protein
MFTMKRYLDGYNFVYDTVCATYILVILVELQDIILSVTNLLFSVSKCSALCLFAGEVLPTITKIS